MYKVYEWDQEEYAYEALDDEEQVEEECIIRRKHKAKKLSPQMMDMMTDEEIEDWYERNGRYDYDY